MSTHAARTHQEIIFALIIGIPLAVFLMRRGGEGVVPALAAIATAFFMGFVVPHVPGSPNGCLLNHTPDPCASYTPVLLMNVGAPLLVAFICAEVRGHGRGRP